MSGGNAYKRKSHRRIEVITSVAAVVVLYVILESFGVTCPIKYITGISCAGCGMSRAWISLLHFNIHDAFMYHPLFFLPPGAGFLIAFLSCVSVICCGYAVRTKALRLILCILFGFLGLAVPETFIFYPCLFYLFFHLSFL